jgi:hypothetical protein
VVVVDGSVVVVTGWVVEVGWVVVVGWVSGGPLVAAAVAGLNTTMLTVGDTQAAARVPRRNISRRVIPPITDMLPYSCLVRHSAQVLFRSAVSSDGVLEGARSLVVGGAQIGSAL